MEQVVGSAARQTAALILDLDQDALLAGGDAQRDDGGGLGELERVLENVRDHRGEDLAVGQDRYAGLDGDDVELDAARGGFQRRARRDFLDEAAEQDRFLVLNPLGEPELGQRSADQRTEAHQAALQDGAGAAADADVSRLENLERDDPGIDQVAQLVCEEAQALLLARVLPHDGGLVARAPVFGHGAGDRVVQAPVQGAELVDGHRRLGLHSQFGDGLTDVAVGMDDLRHRESLKQEVVTVLDRAVADFDAGNRTLAQGAPQLVQEHRHAVDADRRRLPGQRRPGCNLLPAAPDDLAPIQGDEFLKHGHLRVHGRPFPSCSIWNTRLVEVTRKKLPT